MGAMMASGSSSSGRLLKVLQDERCMLTTSTLSARLYLSHIAEKRVYSLDRYKSRLVASHSIEGSIVQCICQRCLFYQSVSLTESLIPAIGSKILTSISKIEVFPPKAGGKLGEKKVE